MRKVLFSLALLLLVSGLWAPAASSLYADGPQSEDNPSVVSYYDVKKGDSLSSISYHFNVKTYEIARANNLSNNSVIHPGQELAIPAPSAPLIEYFLANPITSKDVITATHGHHLVVAAPVVNPPTQDKWIDVNISQQRITAYEGSKPVKTAVVSTGRAGHETVVGQYHIYWKLPARDMRGGTPGIDYYFLPKVPWTMFWYQGYAIHGTYWHDNFGHPMSHGCVNLTIDEAKWFYDWAPLGTLVVSHY
jgi:lipoprotein-anchoring transpeptidase ErfK/SrfK